jgi:hypothetical protein
LSTTKLINIKNSSIDYQAFANYFGMTPFF